MRDDILVVDDVLPPEAFDNLARLIANEPMSYGSLSNARTDPHGHWSRKFSAAGRHNLADVSFALEENQEFKALNVAWKILRDAHLNEGLLIRCYLNGYTYGTDGYFHTDSDRTDEHTAILFMNLNWEPDWAGETAFLDERGDIVKSVLPKKNRAVIFPAQFRHVGRGVSRKCTALRQTLIYKARKKRSDNFEKLSAFLRKSGALNYGHKTGTLHDHLVRTFSILESRGFEEEVCFGGGLHAIYGTNIFAHSLMTMAAKPAIVAAFGEAAEQLASLFSSLDRPKTLEFPLELTPDAAVVALRDQQKLTLSRAVFDKLRWIECANLIDQNALGSHQALIQEWMTFAAKGSAPA
jgi:2OG-Fe(II) oxygenase superfamily